MNIAKVQEDLDIVKGFYRKVGSLDPLVMEIEYEDFQVVVKYMKIMKLAPYELQAYFRYAYIDGLTDWELETRYMKSERYMKSLQGKLRGYLLKAQKCKGGEMSDD